MAFIFQKVGRSRAEIFKILKNGSSSAITPGDAVCYDYSTASDGVAVILPTTVLLGLFAGFVADGVTLAASGTDGQYGKVQIYGHHPAMRWAGATIGIGCPLVPQNATGAMAIGATHATSITTANNEIQYAWAGTNMVIASSLYSSTTHVGFIRAM